MFPKNDDKDEVSNGKEPKNTGELQPDDCEEFRGRLQAIVDGVDKKYSAVQEDLPKLPVYDPSFKKAETLCTNLVKEAQGLLMSSPYQDEETARLIELASESQTMQYPPARKIGLIGDSAAGESSLSFCSSPNH